MSAYDRRIWEWNSYFCEARWCSGHNTGLESRQRHYFGAFNLGQVTHSHCLAPTIRRSFVDIWSVNKGIYLIYLWRHFEVLNMTFYYITYQYFLLFSAALDIRHSLWGRDGAGTKSPEADQSWHIMPTDRPNILCKFSCFLPFVMSSKGRPIRGVWRSWRHSVV